MAATPTAPPATDAPCRALGLRERKKQRTRDALVEAAHGLFLSQGYARTTVDEIAAAVDVSQRTFFRYFANKDEAALAVLADAEDYFIACLRRRPAEENPVQAMRAAITESWRGLGSEHSGGVTAALELLQLIESTPTLLAAHLRRTTEQEGVVAQVLADREGLDPATDLRPRLLAAVFGAVLRVSHLAWGSDPLPQPGVGPEGMIAIIERHFDQLGPALVGDWR
ncbi:TetR/AcrR family transcriptional regulator [Kitasatospora mediocidica]|uniref:TetR/AcrR family transcriptional regulator n=1 Tax=Kitasatospora mediocidica TaxID=58352 RepID=UPI00056255B4|nr:TetR family transcriptional regulator [Kitasatospora mediocidica]